MRSTRTCTIGLALLLAASAALASWYDDYDEGLTAARKGKWSIVIDRMTAAINSNHNETDKAKTYGTIFINYHPYYYRGVAYLNTGKYEQAISDLEHTTGVGPEDLGSIEGLMSRAKSKLAQSNTPTAPEPQPPAPQPRVVPAPVPVPVQPVAPVIDSALRQRAAAAIGQANVRITAAQQRKATSAPQYTLATQALTDALTRSDNPRSNDDLNAAIDKANRAAAFADLAQAPIASAPPPTTILTRQTQASALVLGDTSRRVREALEIYFRGDFEEASSRFLGLSRDMPNNGWIWAFLGASQYSQYAFDPDKRNEREAAMKSFLKAKTLRKWNSGLPQRYFSKRIQKAFASAS